MPPGDMFTAGVDIGSVSSKAVLMLNGQVCATSLYRTGYSSPDSARKVMDAVLNKTGLTERDVKYVVGTGYGRVNVPFANKTITEITCHARGAHYLNPNVRTILDMGGQDLKAIRCDANGRVTEFLMNDKCAAGTGRAMEVIADIVSVPITEIGPVSLTAKREPEISSTCVVFAKSEAVRLLREGYSVPEVLAAYCAAMARRIVGLLNRIGVEREFAITGGIAKNVGVVKRVEEALGIKAIELTADPALAGAIGAALIARELYLKTQGG